MKYYFTLVGIVFILLIFSCNSVHKYNETINAKHSVPELREDVDIAYTQLQKFQPQLYQYISKEELDYSFDSLKNSFTQPLDSKEFAQALTKVVGKIRQGHNRVYIPNTRLDKKQYKKSKKYSFDFYKLDFDLANDTVYVSNNTTKDTLFDKAQVLAVNDEPIDSIINRYLPMVNSDGFNKTLHKKIIVERFGNYYYNEFGRIDSVDVTFQKNDSIWTTHFKRYLKDEKKQAEAIDSVKTQLNDINHSKPASNPKKSKKDKSTDKIKEKKKREYNQIRGYNSNTKLYNRELSFIGEDSSVAYLKLRSFTKGNYEKFYKQAFEKIDSAQAETLIIDMRDNLGGRLDEIDELYSYLTDEEYVFLNPSEVTSRSSFYKSVYSFTGPVGDAFIVLFTPIIYPIMLFRTSKDSDGRVYYKFSNNKPAEPKENNFKGNIYVIINGTSFSASSVLATALETHDNVTFVGQESGGDFNGTVAGSMKQKTLPNTKTDLRFGIFYIDHPNKRDLKGRGTFPDQEIQSTYSEIVQGKDAEIDWILQDVYGDQETSPEDSGPEGPQ